MRKGEMIAMIMTYDYPSAIIHVARTGIDLVFVGDSVAMVELGNWTTEHLNMRHMSHHLGL